MMTKRNYSVEIFKQIIDFLEDTEIPYEENEERGTIRYYDGTEGDYHLYSEAIIHVRESTVSSLCFIEMGLNVDDPKEMDRMSEFITRANDRLHYGCFSIDYEDGNIFYNFVIDLEEMQLSELMMCDLLSVPLVLQDRYLPGLVKVKYAGMNPKKAFEMCEK